MGKTLAVFLACNLVFSSVKITKVDGLFINAIKPKNMIKLGTAVLRLS
jgi:hypothetical protein